MVKPLLHRVFSRDVTAAMLVTLNKEWQPCRCPQLILWEFNTIVMQMFSLFWLKNMITDHMGENTLFNCEQCTPTQNPLF